MPATFASAITCIDGRVHAPLAEWIRQRFAVHHVDLITDPGADAACARSDSLDLDRILARVTVSTTAHASTTLVIAGHADCAANPADDATHHRDIAAAVERIRGLTDGLTVGGAWVDARGRVTSVADRMSPAR
jgi:carbonic anhydrase